MFSTERLASLGLVISKPRELKRQEHRALRERWQSRFLSGVVEMTGAARYGESDWEPFADGVVESREGYLALECLQRSLPASVFVMTDRGTGPYWCVWGELLRVQPRQSVEDLLIVHHDMLWTFLWPHEEGCGPFYADCID